MDSGFCSCHRRHRDPYVAICQAKNRNSISISCSVQISYQALPKCLETNLVQYFKHMFHLWMKRHTFSKVIRDISTSTLSIIIIISCLAKCQCRSGCHAPRFSFTNFPYSGKHLQLLVKKLSVNKKLWWSCLSLCVCVCVRSAFSHHRFEVC